MPPLCHPDLLLGAIVLLDRLVDGLLEVFQLGDTVQPNAGHDISRWFWTLSSKLQKQQINGAVLFSNNRRRVDGHDGRFVIEV